MFPAIALIEFGSIAAGMFAADKMVKRARVELLHAGTVQPGKYLVLVGGGTAEGFRHSGHACLLFKGRSWNGRECGTGQQNFK